MVSQLAARRCRSLDVIGIVSVVPSVGGALVGRRVDVITEIGVAARHQLAARFACTAIGADAGGGNEPVFTIRIEARPAPPRKEIRRVIRGTIPRIDADAGKFCVHEPCAVRCRQ
jgi:hypothetical protein